MPFSFILWLYGSAFGLNTDQQIASYERKNEGVSSGGVVSFLPLMKS
jgi:hypothetical protein